VSFELRRDAFGRLVYIGADGVAHVGVLPVRAFPITAADDGLSLMKAEGHELLWIDRLDALPSSQRELLDDELAHREFMPQIQRLRAVSTFSTPSTWTVDTDRGSTQLVLKGEEDIRRIGRSMLLIADSQGLQFVVPDLGTLDRHSKRLLERFL
jgi:Domain of unknown function (DUF1854)